MTSHEIALRLISARRWHNGELVLLVDKALSGEPITIDDFDYQGKDKVEKWQQLTGETDR